jgi:hypothetical protein
MKFVWLHITFALLALSGTYTIRADEGCIDNSRHMQAEYDSNMNRVYDNKEYRRVPCACPCGKRYKLSPDRGRCMQCLHYHVPKPLNILWPEKEKNSIHAAPKKVVTYSRKKALLTKAN